MSSKWSKGSSGPAGDEVANLVAHTVEAGVARTLLGKAQSSHAEDQETYVTHSLTGEGFDASEDVGKSDGVCVAFQTRGSNLDVGEIAGTIGSNADRASGSAPCIAFSCKDHGADAGEIAPTLRSMGHDGSHANGGGQIAVAFDTTQITSKANRSNPQPGDPCHPITSEGHPPCVAMQAGVTRENPASGPDGVGIRTDGAAFTLEARAEVQAVAFRAAGQDGFTPSNVTPPIAATDGGGAGAPTVAINTAVRRLTPLECERLQGFPDNYTRIPSAFVRKLGIPIEALDEDNPKHWSEDGPRYKALGNSMAVNCMVWIGQRIDELSTISG